MLGSLLASFIVWLFIRDWRMVLISSIAIPTSIVTTFTLMRMMDFTLNSMTLLGLTLAVGIVIDDAIIVLENIYRFIEEKGMPPMQAAIEATQEIALAVIATTISLVIIFVPIAFMIGLRQALHEPVRLDHGDLHHGLDAGGVHADADAERPAAEARDQARGHEGARRITAAGWSGCMCDPRLVDAPSLGHRGDLRR